jgi:hypothetical protein
MLIRSVRRRAATVLGVLAAASALVLPGSAAATVRSPAPARGLEVNECLGSGSMGWSPSLGSGVQEENWNVVVNYRACGVIDVGDGSGAYPLSLNLTGTEHDGCGDSTTDHVGKGMITWSDGTAGDATVSDVSQHTLDGSIVGTYRVDVTDGTHRGHHFTNEAVGLGTCPEYSVDFTETATLS